MGARPRTDLHVLALERELLDGVGLHENGDRVDVAVLPAFSDERPLQGMLGFVDWRCSGWLSELAREAFCSGAIGESVLVPGRANLPVERLVLLGLGPKAGFDDERARATALAMVEVAHRMRAKDVLYALPTALADRKLLEVLFSQLATAMGVSVLQPSLTGVQLTDAPHFGDDRSDVAATDPTDEGYAGSGAEGATIPSDGDDEAATPVRALRFDDDAAEVVTIALPKTAWVVVESRHVQRLRRLLDGSPRPASVS